MAGVGAARTLALALAIDAVVGEPPAAVHPVVWMGRLLAALERAAPSGGRGAQLLYGAAVAVGAPLAWGLAGRALERRLPWWAAAALLKPTFAGRALLGAAREVEAALAQDDVGAARARLAALVSRPTAHLGPGLAAAAAIESLAENLADSWVAPLAAYACFGLGGAYAYRAANTGDAMWGYRDERYAWLGKAAARLDDVLNLVPSRLAALLLVAAAPDRPAALRAWRRDAGRTASPNAGQPMAAAAGALGVRLEKVGHYTLNPPGREPTPADVRRARGLVGRAMLLCAILALVRVGARCG